jgi:hypothetical protein
MPIDNPPPPPPAKVEQKGKASDAGIADMRDAFERKTPQTAEDRARARAFIEGKIAMLRSDPHMTEAEKAAAIADLEAQRDAVGTEGEKKRPDKPLP